MSGTPPIRMTRDLELEMARLEVKLLRAQFNSHFLFNNLSAVNYRILNHESADASRYLGVFSRLLRRMLSDSRGDFVTLSEEVETLQLYVKMENLRFDRRIEFVISIEPGVAPDLIQLPSMMLHTYLENAIWCSLRPGNSAYTIRLLVALRGGKLHLSLEDFGAETPGIESRNVPAQQELSLSLVEDRMRLLNERYGTDIEVQTRHTVSETERNRVSVSFTPFYIKNINQVTQY